MGLTRGSSRHSRVVADQAERGDHAPGLLTISSWTSAPPGTNAQPPIRLTSSRVATRHAIGADARPESLGAGPAGSSPVAPDTDPTRESAVYHGRDGLRHPVGGARAVPDRCFVRFPDRADGPSRFRR